MKVYKEILRESFEDYWSTNDCKPLITDRDYQVVMLSLFSDEQLTLEQISVRFSISYTRAHQLWVKVRKNWFTYLLKKKTPLYHMLIKIEPNISRLPMKQFKKLLRT